MDSKQTNKAKPADPHKPQGPARARRKASTPAYLQRKLRVSDPKDAEEKEADAVAADVKRRARPAPDEATPPLASAQRVVARSVARQAGEEEEEAMMPKVRRQEEEEAAQPKLQREEEEEAAQPKLMRQPAEEEETAHPKLWRKGEEEEAQTKLWRKAADEEEAPLMTKLWRQEEEEPQATAPSEGQQDTATAMVEQRIQNSRGNGTPLPDTVLKDMEQQFGQDFSRVVIHTDNEAAELCQKLNARAFTIGSDIYFAPGEFTPETETGRELLAHELTHVVQQGRHVARKIHRSIDPADTPADNDNVTTALENLSNLRIPAIKQRHLPLYTQLANSGQLARIRNYTRPSRGSNTTRQSSAWKRDIQPSESDVAAKLQALEPSINWPTNRNHAVTFSLPNHSEQLSFSKSKFLRNIVKVPKWDREGNYVRQYQVDHIVELQTSGAHGTRNAVGNNLENMELLDQPSNSSSGSSIMSGIYSRVDDYLDTIPEEVRLPKSEWLRTHDIIFDRVSVDSGMGMSEGDSSWWTRAEVQALDPLDSIRGVPPMSYEGDDRSFVLYSGPGGIEVGRFGHPRGALEFQPRQRSARCLSGIIIESVQLTDQTELNFREAPGPIIGNLSGRWDLPPLWQPDNPQVTLQIGGLGPYAGYALPPPPPAVDFSPTSPALFSELEIGSEGFVAEGEIPTPSIPLLSNTALNLSWIGNDILLRAEYRPDDLNLPLPGLTITEGAIALSYGRQQGFGVDGTIYFGIENLGSGNLTAGYTQSRGFHASGSFDFDSKLFDEASATLRYQNNQFSGDGTLRISNPDKIRGIHSAEITVEFSDDSFAASGDVDPDIPGVEQVGLAVDYSEEAGLTIGGNLQLTANPAIRSGSIEVTVNKRGDDWRVSATGTAQPAIPGVDSQLTVGYDDGAFTAEFSGAYQRGMLSGRVTVGATNRAVGEDGRPSGDPLPEGALNIYGAGSATIQIAPWLQGTAGIRFDPNGEVTVSGEIGIPNEVEIFARREVNKSIFSIAVQVPIVPGIVAEVGGGLGAVAGIGPGMIDEMRIGITYNPAHEEDTRVTGDAHLSVPADAGLRLSVRAGIGLGITGASATGGLDIGGTLGIEGAAEAGVHIDWTPSDGLDLSANLAIHAQPSFTFDIGGYVSVRALGFSVYDERWQFASYSFGSGYRFGIRLPVHYHEGEPFDISLDDVQFEVPDIDTNQLLRGLIGRIA
ncbi:DUF4157 domain-containing protein [Halomonas sp. H10-9-1]|uniref:eCIS core domain-containing protein n=1 Tax=Halomonas sp. H10-9-1 TaxID=2950871 RepID=UPI0032DE6FF1